MKKSILAAVVAAATALPGVSFADLAFNVGAVSDYRYRGISQTRLKPALQGGVDYSLGGFYVGSWASTIKWVKDAGGDANVEIDVYAGYKGEITKGFGYDVGVLTYWYPNNDLTTDADTTEIYGALTYGPATLKYSHAVTDTFGNADSKNSHYVDLSANFEAPWGLTITPHVGYQKIKNSGAASYTDYSLTVSKEVVKGLNVSLAVVGTDADKSVYSSPVNGKFLGKTSAVLGVKYNF